MNTVLAIQQPDLDEGPVDENFKPRKPWLAALMSLMLPGFGQVYNGQFNRGTWFFLVFAVLVLPVVTLAALYVPPAWTMGVLLLGVGGGLLLWLFSIFDAWRNARARQNYHLKQWQTGGAYITIYILCSLIGLPAAGQYVRNKQVQSFRTVSNSMWPTLFHGDFFFTDMRYNCTNCAEEVERGDVAVFVYPNNRNLMWVKRIVALPGDEVIYKSRNSVFVNGKPLENRASAVSGASDSASDASKVVKSASGSAVSKVNTTDAAEAERAADSLSGPEQEKVFIVPPREVFVLGDNWEGSADSRTHGTVPLSDIRGLVRQIWFSKDDSGIRWDRIGLDLRS